MKNRFCLLLLAMSILSSCSVMKSKYGRGVSFHWKSGHTPNLVHQDGREEKKVSVLMEEKSEANIEERLVIANVENTDLSEVFQAHTLFPITKQRACSTSKAEGLIQTLEGSNQANISAIEPTEQQVKGAAHQGPEDKWLLILLAFFLPPLTIYLLDESDTHGLIISVILTLLGCYIAGVIHAIIKVIKNYESA